MDKCCTTQLQPRPQRRINGLQLPLNLQQVIGWIVFLVTALLNLFVLTAIQLTELKIVSLIIYAILYVTHIASHVVALMTDPSEKDLRKLKANNVPEFDRNVHAHVIENGRCHLCNIYTSSKNTKHCSICNKCVDRFDHHCKWLNNCVGRRNYLAFITCVVTALLISLLTFILCLTDVILFLISTKNFSSAAQNFINCNLTDSSNVNKYCKNSITFLSFLIILGTSALAIGCALSHLCCFHVYISMLGVSTYEYIVKSNVGRSTHPKCNGSKCCNVGLGGRLYMISKKRERTRDSNSIDNEAVNTSVQTQTNASEVRVVSEDVAGLITGLIANQLDRARKVVFYDKNKIHPQTENS